MTPEQESAMNALIEMVCSQANVINAQANALIALNEMYQAVLSQLDAEKAIAKAAR